MCQFTIKHPGLQGRERLSPDFYDAVLRRLKASDRGLSNLAPCLEVGTRLQGYPADEKN